MLNRLYSNRLTGIAPQCPWGRVYKMLTMGKSYWICVIEHNNWMQKININGHRRIPLSMIWPFKWFETKHGLFELLIDHSSHRAILYIISDMISWDMLKFLGIGYYIDIIRHHKSYFTCQSNHNARENFTRSNVLSKSARRCGNV